MSNDLLKIACKINHGVDKLFGIIEFILYSITLKPIIIFFNILDYLLDKFFRSEKLCLSFAFIIVAFLNCCLPVFVIIKLYILNIPLYTNIDEFFLFVCISIISGMMYYIEIKCINMIFKDYCKEKLKGDYNEF